MECSGLSPGRGNTIQYTMIRVHPSDGCLELIVSRRVWGRHHVFTVSWKVLRQLYGVHHDCRGRGQSHVSSGHDDGFRFLMVTMGFSIRFLGRHCHNDCRCAQNDDDVETDDDCIQANVYLVTCGKVVVSFLRFPLYDFSFQGCNNSSATSPASACPGAPGCTNGATGIIVELCTGCCQKFWFRTAHRAVIGHAIYCIIVASDILIFFRSHSYDIMDEVRCCCAGLLELDHPPKRLGADAAPTSLGRQASSC